MQLNFKGLTLRNFISTGAVTQAIDLSSNGLTLILGQLIDSNGQVSRNGAGKSTIAHALSYVLFGQALSKIRVDNLINDINQKNMLVTLDFEIGEDQYRIERGRKPAVFKFFKNGAEYKQDNNAKGEGAETQEDIDKIVGMDHTMFCHIVALNTQTIPFLKETAGKQREIIEKLLGVTQISERAKVLTKLMGLTKDEIKTHEATINATRDANIRIQQSVDTAKSKALNWDRTQEATIAEVKSLLAALSAIDIDAELAAIDRVQSYDAEKKEFENALVQTKRELDLVEREARAAAQEIDRLRRAAEAFDPDGELPKLKRTLDTLDYDHSTLTKKRATAITLQTSLDADIEKKSDEIKNANGSECTTCGQSLEGTDHLDHILDRLNKAKVGLEADRIKAENEVKEIDTKLSALVDERAIAERAIETTKVELESEQAERKTLFENASASASQDDAARQKLSDDISAITNALAAHGARPTSAYATAAEVYQVRQDRAALEAEETRLNSEVNPHVDQIAAFEAAIHELDYTPLHEAQDMLKHQELMQKLLVNKDSFIRKKIIDQNLSTLNDRLSHYLECLVSTFEIKLKSDLTVEISKMGRDYDFEQLSKGESNRVVLAISWAFRDLWESLNIPVNLIFCDELLDSGLDATGSEDALQVLKALARDRNKNVFLISHKEELRGRIDRTLLISKSDGFSEFNFDEF